MCTLHADSAQRQQRGGHGRLGRDALELGLLGRGAGVGHAAQQRVGLHAHRRVLNHYFHYDLVTKVAVCIELALYKG